MTAAAKKVPTLPGPYSYAEAITRLITVAASQIGYREGKSGSDWNNDTFFGKWYGLNGNAWCAMFVSWCAQQAGYADIIPKHAYTPSGFAWFKARNLHGGRVPPNKVGRAATGLGQPRRGDIMYVYSSSLGRISHVGIVENVLAGGYIQTIEGNTDPGGSAQGNGVYRLKRKNTARLYFVRPVYDHVIKPRPKPPAVKPKPNPASGGNTPAKVDKFGQPLTGGNPKTDSAHKQVLELPVLVAVAKITGTPTYTMWAQTAAACRSLKKMGLMPVKAVVTGPNFKAAWRRYQVSLGYAGKDADGNPGVTSFSRFVERTGRSRMPYTGYKAK